MANEYLKPQKPLKDLNSENYFYPLTTSDQVFLLDTTTRLSSLIDKTYFTASRAIYYNGTKLLSSNNIFLNDSQIGINRTSLDAAYKFSVVGNSLFNGILYFANGTTYFLNNSADTTLRNITAYSSYTLNTSAATDSLAMRISTRAGTSSIGTNNYTSATVTQNDWAQIYYRTPILRTIYETAGDTSSAVTSSSYFQPYWWFRQWSVNTSNGARTSYHESYSLPATDNNRTANASYKIITTKNLTDADSRFVTLSTTQTISGSKTFSAFVNGTINAARYLENRGGSTVTINDAAWNHGQTGANGSTNRATVWHQRWLQSGLTYTPSGGSATTLTDCGDMVIWLSSSPTSNLLQANIAIDGLMYAMDGFKTGQWYRSIGNTGWYSETHGGGWYMSDSTWLRSYNSKAVYSGSGIIRSDSAVWGNSVVINSNWVGFYNGVQGSTRYGYVQANNNRMYFRKENGAQNNISFDFAGHIYNNSEYISGADNGFRIKSVILRVDGSNFYFLVGTANTPGNNWNSLRPFYFNLSNGYSYHTRAYQAVWNDYAEFRQGDTIEPGRVVIEQKNGIMTMAQERLAPGAKIISDTYGQAMGETKTAKTPIAVSGRVLVYPFRDRNKYELGAAVCAAPGGTVDIMTREEIREYPERIVGTVSEIPNYDIWHCGGDTQQGPREEVKVNGRIWVYVR